MRWTLIILLSLTGCGMIPGMSSDVPEPAGLTETNSDVSGAGQQRPQARPAGGIDAETGQTASPQATAGTLGRTVATLGNAAEPGLWLKTPLVRVQRAGQVRYEVSGNTIEVTLIPIDGPATAGSRLSLGAMQALGAPLTGLVDVEVIGL